MEKNEETAEKLITYIIWASMVLVFLLVVLIKPLFILVLLYSVALLVISLGKIQIPETSVLYTLTLRGETLNSLNLRAREFIKQLVS